MKTKCLGLKVIALVLLSSGCTHVIEKFSESSHRQGLSVPASTGKNSANSNAAIGEQRQVAKVMAQAHQQMAEAIEAAWGSEDVLMPSRKVWVQYVDSMKTRTIMDFERGELRIEHLMTSGESATQAHQMIESALLQARDETIADLDKFDLEMQLARQIARQRGMVITEASTSTQDASMRVLEGLIDTGVVE